jgi:hypothetical protein
MVTWHCLQRASLADDGAKLGLGPVDELRDVFSLGDEVLVRLRHVVVAASLAGKLILIITSAVIIVKWTNYGLQS